VLEDYDPVRGVLDILLKAIVEPDSIISFEALPLL